jgi:hypothetical protein
MGAALNAAAAMPAYTLSDRGTWLSFGNKGDLQINVEGDRDLLNRYDVITLNPKEHRQTGRVAIIPGGADRDRRLHDRRAASVPPRGGPETLIVRTLARRYS